MKILPALICAIFLAQAVQAANLNVLRNPIEMNFGQYPQLYVTFNHSTHKSVQCRICHHMADEQGQRFVKCTREECHSIPGALERDPMSAFMAYHDRATDRSCYGCHLKKRPEHPEFRGCQPCHMDPAAKVALGKKQ